MNCISDTKDFTELGEVFKTLLILWHDQAQVECILVQIQNYLWNIRIQGTC